MKFKPTANVKGVCPRCGRPNVVEHDLLTGDSVVRCESFACIRSLAGTFTRGRRSSDLSESDERIRHRYGLGQYVERSKDREGNKWRRELAKDELADIGERIEIMHSFEVGDHSINGQLVTREPKPYLATPPARGDAASEHWNSLSHLFYRPDVDWSLSALKAASGLTKHQIANALEVGLDHGKIIAFGKNRWRRYAAA